MPWHPELGCNFDLIRHTRRSEETVPGVGGPAMVDIPHETFEVEVTAAPGQRLHIPEGMEFAVHGTLFEALAEAHITNTGRIPVQHVIRAQSATGGDLIIQAGVGCGEGQPTEPVQGGEKSRWDLLMDDAT